MDVGGVDPARYDFLARRGRRGFDLAASLALPSSRPAGAHAWLCLNSRFRSATTVSPFSPVFSPAFIRSEAACWKPI